MCYFSRFGRHATWVKRAELQLTPSGLFMGLSSTIIYTSELILCSTIFELQLSLGKFNYNF